MQRFERPKIQGARQGPLPLARQVELVKVGRLDPPPRMLRRDNSTRGCSTAPIAKQGKASCSRARHPSHPGLGDLGQASEHSGNRRRYPDRCSFQIVAAPREGIQEGSRIRSGCRKRPARRLQLRSRRKAKGSENLRRRCLNLGVDENGENVWQLDRRTEFIANTLHDPGLRRKTGKHVCSRCTGRSAHPRIIDRQSSLVGEQPQSSRRIR